VVPLSATQGTAAAYNTAETRGIFIEASSSELIVDHREIVGPWQSSSTIKASSYSLGTRFRLGGYNLNGNNTTDTGFDYASVYAPFGGTVTLTAPTGAALPFWEASATATLTVTLTAGQTYIARTAPGAVCTREIDGALVTSTEPISVDTGGRGWSGVCSVGGGCGDDGADNVLPTTGVGTEYVVHNFPSASTEGEDVTVVADVAGTEVRVNGALVATLAAGATHTFVVSGVTYVQTSRPAYVYQNSGLSSCELDVALLPPVVLAPLGTWVTDFNVVAASTGQAAVVIAETSFATLRVDGAVPTFLSSVLVPGRADLRAVTFAVAAGNHSVRAGADFQLGLVTSGSGSGLFAYYTPFRVAGCGNGVRVAPEGCDDGNVGDGDGCSSACQIEVGFMGCTITGDCVPAGRCDGGTCVARCLTDASCNDSNACTVDSCSPTGACVNTAVAAGSAGSCAAGQVCSGAPRNRCVQCVSNAQCSGSTAFCNTATNACVGCLAAADCNDGNECTADSCASNACARTPVAVGTACTGGVCNAAQSCVGCIDSAAGTSVDTGCRAEAPQCIVSLAGPATCQACSDTTSGGVDLGCASSAPACVTRLGLSECAPCEDSAMGTMVDNGCSASTPLCAVSPAGNQCVACIASTDCADGNPCTVEGCMLGMCEITGVEAGTAGLCAGGAVCSGPGATAPNTCVQCVGNEQCSGATAFCDLTMNTCGPCTRDFGSVGVGAGVCPEANPLCALSGPMMGVCGRCATNADCAGNPAGSLCDLVSGSCGTACNVDSDCGATEWCPASRVCAPKVANGMSVPTAGPANGMCTMEIGTRTCISGVCFESDDLCGLPNGETCSGAGVCRSEICAPSGACGECDANDDCTGGRVCNVPTGMCVTVDAGMTTRDSGPATTDAGTRDAGAAAFDAGSGADTNGGGIAGGACGCTVNTTKNANGLIAMLSLLGLVVARRRRRA
jgi:cysteine-rich repeat protein